MNAANPGKQLTITVGNVEYARIPLKTHVVTKDDNIIDIVEKYAAPFLQQNDILFISEKIVAISQGRAFPIADIQPSALAKLLVKFVQKSPYGIGLGSPWTMELAIREAGIFKMLFAAFLSAITKPFGIRGVFYKIIGKNINAIDGPCDYTLPPYNKYAKLGPINPNGVAKKIKEKFGCDVVIIDANDIGVNVLGKSNQQISDEFCATVFKDNPLGQASEQTPIGILRKI
ncbi:coenzyme F420-0:L-glutamate ligase [Candidatus Falkowbacteria bacterium]|nr:coenzyme F420-0:L-glutamate ligase [Candidatus Falkowbacteria bacterium]